LKEDEQAVVPRKVGAELGLVPKKRTAGVPKEPGNLVVVYEKALEAMTQLLQSLMKYGQVEVSVTNSGIFVELLPTEEKAQ
tara:strand:- start:243 stop:485 length:243 start_codon:yes stop_codon:yes gene_type:complete